MSDTMRKFSILMASYNNGNFIEQSIRSVLDQNYNKWELIIVDDFSSDNSVEIISKFLSDQRIKLFINDKNYGCGYTKRRCAKCATGDVMGELDPDDVLCADAISVMVDVHNDNPDCGFIYSTHYECDSLLRVKKINDWIKDCEQSKTNLLNHSASQLRTYKKKDYNKTSGFSEKMMKAVDKDLIYKMEEITKLKFIDKPLYKYRMHDNGISLGKNNFEAKAWDIYARHNSYKRRIGKDIINLSENDISYLLLEGSLRFLFVGNIKMSIILFLRGVAMGPSFFWGIFVLIKKIIK